MVVIQPKHPQIIARRNVTKMKRKQNSLFTVVNDRYSSVHHFKIKLFNLLQIVKNQRVYSRARKEGVERRGSQSPLGGRLR